MYPAGGWYVRPKSVPESVIGMRVITDPQIMRTSIKTVVRNKERCKLHIHGFDKQEL